MVAVIIFAVSIVALAQFGLYYWRATISGVAAQAISDRIRVASGITHATIGARDFHNILVLNNLSPDLRGPNGNFRTIRAYYAINVLRLNRSIRLSDKSVLFARNRFSAFGWGLGSLF